MISKTSTLSTITICKCKNEDGFFCQSLREIEDMIQLLDQTCLTEEKYAAQNQISKEKCATENLK